MFTLGEVMLTGLAAGVVGTGLSAAEPARERPRLWVRRIAGVRGSFLAHRPWRHDDGAWGEVQTSRNHGPPPLGPGKALLKAVPTSSTRAGLPRPGIDFPHRIREWSASYSHCRRAHEQGQFATVSSRDDARPAVAAQVVTCAPAGRHR